MDILEIDTFDNVLTDDIFPDIRRNDIENAQDKDCMEQNHADKTDTTGCIDFPVSFLFGRVSDICHECTRYVDDYDGYKQWITTDEIKMHTPLFHMENLSE